jgi:hypothetical protein
MRLWPNDIQRFADVADGVKTDSHCTTQDCSILQAKSLRPWKQTVSTLRG